MDIRKWLKPPNQTSVSRGDDKKDNSSKESVTKENAKSNSKKAAKTSKKRRVIESDSDEDPLPQQKKPNKKKSSEEVSTADESPESRKRKASKSPKKSSQKNAVPVEKKPVSVASFFGAAPVQRASKKPVPKVEAPPPENNHDDDDFCETLAILEEDNFDDIFEVANEDKKSNAKKPSEKKSVPNKPASKKKMTRYESIAELEITNVPKKTVTKIVNEKTPPTKKRNGGANYVSYLHREPPKSLGSKEIPEGEKNCLKGLSFVVTGVLESMERDEAKDLIEEYGGKVMSNISKNTNYIVIGRDAGQSKLEKAEKFKTKQLDEDGLLELVRTTPGEKGAKIPSPKKDDEEIILLVDKKQSPKKITMVDPPSVSPVKVSVTKSPKKVPTSNTSEQKPVVTPSVGKETYSMWVDKYKPTSLKQIIGQQGEKSNVVKLLHWLKNWSKNRKLNKKPIPGRWNQDDGSGFRAALLSGPPGVGKTTSAQLVCKEAGFSLFELNASDTRSKKSLQQVMSQLLGNQTIEDHSRVSSNHVIVMDEVDGMAGNEDRGGVQELIGFIKTSKIPIICICNDRNHPKIRSLANYCFDLRYQKPRVEQIKVAMLSIAFKEGVKVPTSVLQDVIVGSNQDIRQVLHNLSMWTAKEKCLTVEQTKSDIGKGTKHIKLGPFDVLREVFAIGNNPNATLMDKSDLFFHDYSAGPLFVQENYVHVLPTAAEGDKIKHLKLLSETADNIAIGDTVERRIRSQNNWGLLPTQAIFSSVVPGELMRGHLRQMINFPAWFGKNSNHKHMERVLQALHMHMRMKITGNKTDIVLEYLPLLKGALTTPLIEEEVEGVPKVLKTMEEYYLLREDFDSVIDLSLWHGQVDPRTKIITKVKSAFTRTYNKEMGRNPYSVTNIKKKKRSGKDEEDEMDGLSSEEEEDDSLENDAMIKVKKPVKKTAAKTEQASTSKASGSKQPKKPRSKK